MQKASEVKKHIESLEHDLHLEKDRYKHDSQKKHIEALELAYSNYINALKDYFDTHIRRKPYRMAYLKAIVEYKHLVKQHPLECDQDLHLSILKTHTHILKKLTRRHFKTINLNAQQEYVEALRQNLNKCFSTALSMEYIAALEELDHALLQKEMSIVSKAKHFFIHKKENEIKKSNEIINRIINGSLYLIENVKGNWMFRNDHDGITHGVKNILRISLLKKRAHVRKIAYYAKLIQLKHNTHTINKTLPRKIQQRNLLRKQAEDFKSNAENLRNNLQKQEEELKNIESQMSPASIAGRKNKFSRVYQHLKDEIKTLRHLLFNAYELNPDSDDIITNSPTYKNIKKAYNNVNQEIEEISQKATSLEEETASLQAKFSFSHEIEIEKPFYPDSVLNAV